MTASLKTYIADQVARAGINSSTGQLFAKVLTPNNDSGRHGVLAPSEAYDFFPVLAIDDTEANATTEFTAFDLSTAKWTQLAYKYYQRYPERRITRLPPSINDRSLGWRLVVVLKATTPSGNPAYLIDAATEKGDGRFADLWALVAGPVVPVEAGAFVTAPFDFAGLTIDTALDDFLVKFDALSGTWVESLRIGDTGIGYTFETLLGIKENNSKLADFQGIEIKCKRNKNEKKPAGGKLNLFQQAPTWTPKITNMALLQIVGQPDAKGRLVCHSQINTSPNNLGLFLNVSDLELLIRLQINSGNLGYWDNAVLERRLREKHSRAVLVKAQNRMSGGKESFLFNEVIYCEQPSISSFLELVRENKVVLELLMSQRGKGVRNHGYPWRLVSEGLLDRLFALRVKLR